MRIFKIIWESSVQAVQELNGNKLRSFLSSLGITIGIFCIISVLSAVDSLQYNISQSFEKLGSDVIYVDRVPWTEDPGDNWWKYRRRPAPDHDDYVALKTRVKGAEYASLTIFIPGRTIEFKSSHVQGAYMAGITYDYADITKLEYDAGRYFTPYEYTSGANRVILGNQLANDLFREIDPIGRMVKIAGQRFQVIGVLQKEGSSLINIFNYDEAVLIGFNTAKKLVNVRSGTNWGTLMNVKARPGVAMADLEDEVRGVMRAHRKLRPSEDDNFSINELSMFTDILDSFFGVMKFIGFLIGLFAIIVGAFSVANIMFVSVKERTNIIGIKKALGARRWVILLEFLVEAVLLCIAGGLLGLGVVMLAMKVLSGVFNYEMFLSVANISWGVIGAIIIGTIAGIIPALQAARMDPVEAIRQ
jgi:putative ABC transport system permease protein